MNNRYLYRAKRCDAGEWVIGFYHWINWRNPQTKEIVNTTHYILPIDYQDSYHIDPSTICACTALKDKNGKMIWENDIVNCFEAECCGKISWNESEAGFYFDVLLEDGAYEEERIYDYVDCMEVIGNIFDNPELLEVGE